MTIQTKYNVGEEVWANLWTEATKLVVSHMDLYIEKGTGLLRIYYWCSSTKAPNAYYKFEEYELYQTELELLEHNKRIAERHYKDVLGK